MQIRTKGYRIWLWQGVESRVLGAQEERNYTVMHQPSRCGGRMFIASGKCASTTITNKSYCYASELGVAFVDIPLDCTLLIFNECGQSRGVRDIQR